MRSKSFEGMACSIAGVLEAIGDRWAVLILRDLSLGLSRYEDLRRSTEVTNATLSDRLKHLEDHELIERRQYQTNPERYEYVLTREGPGHHPGDPGAAAGGRQVGGFRRCRAAAQIRRSKDRARW